MYPLRLVFGSAVGFQGTMAVAEQRSSWTRPLDAAGMVRAQVREVHQDLDNYFTRWLGSIAPAAPPSGSRVVPLYLHAATVEDVTIHSLLRQVPPLFATDWTGIGPGQYSTADLAPLRAYAQQVHADTDAYLAQLANDQLNQVIDLSRLGLGQPTVLWVVSRFVVLQVAQIFGELTSASQFP